MIKRRYGRTLDRNPLISEEDVNPLDSVANLTDCMLVIVVGLLVALVTYFNVDLTQAQQEDQSVGNEVVMDADSDGEIDDNYQESGTVYYDKNTGKYYMVTK